MQGLADAFEGLDKVFQIVRREVSEGAAVGVDQRGIKRRDEVKAGLGDHRPHHAAIIVIAPAVHEAAFDQPVEQPRDIRIARDHSVGNFAAPQAVRPDAPEDAQHVVLRVRQPRGGKDPLFDLPMQDIGGANDVQMSLLLKAVKRAALG